MNLISLENITKSYSEKLLLDNVSLNINEGEKIGVIGLNGAGKSTLLKIIAGFDEFFDGNINKSKDLRIEYLGQNPRIDLNATVIEQVFKSETDEIQLLMNYEKLLEKINLGIASNEDNQRLIQLQSDIDNKGLWNLENEAKSILTKLGIKNYNAKMESLSGGQRKRVFLAASLITPCDLLILDEPTNHLDSESIEWLEEYLNMRKGALLMITHDRYFLDRVANKILELDRGNLYLYEGNYSLFLEKKSERMARETSMEDKRQKLIIKELQWVRRGAKARTTKQKARLQRFDELVSKEYIQEKPDIEMPFIGSRLGKKTIELLNITKKFSNETFIENFSYTFLKEDRVGIIGSNGMGKSTLVNIIRGALEATSGVVEKGETVIVGTFTQDDLHMDLTMKAIDYIREVAEWIPTDKREKISASQLAERFLFDGTLQYTAIEKLSGGERRRLNLLRVLMSAPNVLILDEPTNDLDIETLKILEDFLDEFLGIIIVVSHDRYFLDRVCNKIFSFEGNGLIEKYEGNYSDYLIYSEIRKSTFKEFKDINKVSTKKEYVKNKDERPKFTFKEQKEYEEIHSIITKMEDQINAVEERIEKNPSDYGLLNELTQEKDKLEEDLLIKYERLEYLETIATKIEAYKKR